VSGAMRKQNKLGSNCGTRCCSNSSCPRHFD
jgi:hypothetical protein